MGKIDEVRNKLAQADEIVLDLRSDMEEDIRSYMIETKTQPLKVDVVFGGEKHSMVITIELLSGYNIICNRHDCGTQMANVEFRPEL